MLVERLPTLVRRYDDCLNQSGLRQKTNWLVVLLAHKAKVTMTLCFFLLLFLCHATTSDRLSSNVS